MEEKTGEKKIFSLRQISVGSFLGGPLAAIYFLRKNCDALGQGEKSRNVVMGGGFLTLCLIAILPFLPDSFPNAAIPAGYTAAAAAYARQLIPDEGGFGKFSVWRVLVAAVLGIALFIVAVMIYFMVADALGIISLDEMPAP